MSLTLLLMVIMNGSALFVKDLGLVVGLGGAILGSALVYILPALMAIGEKAGAMGPVITGAQVTAVADWLAVGLAASTLDWTPIKQITRAALNQLTAGRTLHSREIYRQLKKT